MIVGLYLRHIKAYKNIQFIPFGYKYNFMSYIGENGIGKSTILQALDAFFNNQEWPINKSAIEDGLSKSTPPFISPIFLIHKDKISKKKQFFELISNFFWNIDDKKISPRAKGAMKEFYDLKDSLLNSGIYNSDTHYLFIIGSNYFIEKGNEKKEISFSSFHNEEEFKKMFFEDEKSKIDKEISKLDKIKDDLEIRKLGGKISRLQKSYLNDDDFVDKNIRDNYKDVLDIVKNVYSYIYIPVEIDVEKFTKIETENMQKVFDKKIIEQIDDALKEVNIDGINSNLNTFIDDISYILDNEYHYDTGKKSKKNITSNDIVEKVLEAFFQKRILLKGKKGDKNSKKVSELSAGEKRQALINLIYAFLKREKERERDIIIGLDEPENSLNISLCFEQFEKLKEISKNNQVLITTHWYGFLPIVSKGYGHFLDEGNKEKIDFLTYELYNYRSLIKKDIEKSRNIIPSNFELKSINDLIQSIYSSIRNRNNKYNWVICEGISEKIYFEYFFKDEIEKNHLNVLPVGGASKVIEIFDYLFLPISKEKIKNLGKVLCLVDTDNEKLNEKSITEVGDILMLKRLHNLEKNHTEIIKYNDKRIGETEIENSLVPEIFLETLRFFKEEVVSLEIDFGKYDFSNSYNTDYLNGFELTPKEGKKLKEFFDLYNGDMKIRFSKKYIENSFNKDNIGIPKWVTEIKEIFSQSIKNSKNTNIEEIKKIDKKIKNIEEVKDVNDFNIDDFIQKLKDNGAKGGLTMTIRGAKLSIFGNYLNIYVNTKIGKTQLENIDNVRIMKKSLLDLGFISTEINIKYKGT